MVQYKWVALSNTTIGTLMATINQTILLIALPAIFRGIHINALASGSFIYLIWIIMGFNIVTATLLVTFGRLSDIFGRVRLFNMGFAIFTVGSIMLTLTPGLGNTGALELIIFRLIQGVGAAFLFSNAAAILTDAFPHNERGMALGLNMVAALSGSFIGLILGGILATFDWRFVFLVSVPVGFLGTAWSYAKLKDISARDKQQKIDVFGNIAFGGGLTISLVGVTYGLVPYPVGSTNQMGWTNPFVIVSIVIGVALLAIFPFIERKVSQPMFDLRLFRIRPFTAGIFAGMLGSIGRGGFMFILIILLQGIYLPLAGYNFASTPFWAGIYMIPLTIGFLVMGPISGILSDRHGARALATSGMLIVAATFAAMTFLPNATHLQYYELAILLFIMGIGNGMFASPNSAAIMNSLPQDKRGVGSGMRSTLQNAGLTASMAIFFTIVITGLSATLPGSITSSLNSLGASVLDPFFNNVSASSALFSAFLGENPMSVILTQIGPSVTGSLSPTIIGTLTSQFWFPDAISTPFMGALRETFEFGAIISVIAAVASSMRGKKYVMIDSTEPNLSGNGKYDLSSVQTGKVTSERKTKH